MSYYRVVVSHTVYEAFSIEAPSIEEAGVLVMEGEGEFVDSDDGDDYEIVRSVEIPDIRGDDSNCGCCPECYQEQVDAGNGEVQGVSFGSTCDYHNNSEKISNSDEQK